MGERNIKCYLCGKEAKESAFLIEAGRAIGITTIKCSGECKPYKTDEGARKFYFDRPDKKNKLSDHDKQNLIKYVEIEYKKENKPVLITAELIHRISGK